MIPIRDSQPSHMRPVATYALMALNLLFFMVQLQAGLGNQAYFYLFGLVPAKYTVPDVSAHFSLANHFISLFTYMFLHGGFWHFLGNMWTLYIFGDNVEAHFGSLRYLTFYLICGTISGLSHCLLNPVSTVPTIGASGAIAGVMGAYFLLYPKSKILTLIPIFIIIPLFIQVPAFIFLGVWFLIQFLNAAGSGAGAGIAWWAHIGGFLAGMAFVKLHERLPKTGVGEKLRQMNLKKHTPKLQVISPESLDQGPDLYGTIELNSLEALGGARKMITIPWGGHKPLYKVTIPAGIRQGTKLKLAGMGRSLPGRPKGDLFLTVQIKNVF